MIARRVAAGLATLATGALVGCGAATAGSRSGAQGVTVGCAGSVFSPGQTWPDHWPGPRGQAVVAGPVAWPDILALASDSRARGRPGTAAYAPIGGLSHPQKNLVAVTDGATAQVSIPVSERRRLSLDYTYLRPRTTAGRFRVDDGSTAVTFNACPTGSNDAPSTQFAGGFIVAGAQCARVDVQVAGNPARFERRIPFGVPLRTCRPTG